MEILDDPDCVRGVCVLKFGPMESARFAGPDEDSRVLRWQDAGPFLLIAFAYFAMGLLGTGFTGGTAVAPIWPAAGVAMASLVLGGVRFWPAVWIGAFLVPTITTGKFSLISLAIASGSTLGAVIPVLLLKRLFGMSRGFLSPTSIIAFIGLVLVVGGPVSALIGVGSLNLTGQITDARFLKAMYVWWAGDTAGVFLVCPLIVALSGYRWTQQVRKSYAEFILWTGALALVTTLVFFDLVPGVGRNAALAFLPFPLIVATAWTFGTFGGAWATFVVGCISMVGSSMDHGPLAGTWMGNDSSLVLVFIITSALTAMLLGAFKSDLEAAKERVVQRDRQLSQAQGIGGIGTWFWDVQSDLVTWSEGSFRLFGMHEDLGQPRFESMIGRIHPEDRASVLATLAKIRTSGEAATWECRIIKPDGEERTLLSTAALQGSAVAGTTMDVTQRKRLEAQQADLQRKMQETQKLESLGLLAGGIAHDFNNILTGVLGNASLLRLELPPDSPHIESLQKIEASAERAADLCRQMLAYAGKGRTRVQAVNLNHVVRDTWALLHTSLRTEGGLDFQPMPNLPAIVADPSQIRQIVLNLVINASEALPKRGGRITVRTAVKNLTRDYFKAAFLSPELPDGAYVTLVVKDNGSGMSRDVMGKIFDPFFTTKFTGRGLGLPAVAGIVRTHNGAIIVESQEGSGSSFEIAFPASKVEAPIEAHVEADPQAPLGTGRVLVVDDEATVREVASEVLERAGFSVDIARDGVEAAAVVRVNPGRYIYILIDLTMPRLGGAEAISEFRRSGCKVPVILMSGYDRDETLSRLGGNTVAAFVHKPFTPAQLRAAVRQAQEAEKLQSPPRGGW